ncbi:maleylpyruvate isomerase family mycothiol-dependent enzyme [Streptomyces sp. NPDC005805]|uniref:maleylpyruvate isomerase family mycothiol-dependent enzyme n=1 Tax=Streptomyces sp. NPDC005805 TaxID=3157068 RepID=UPI0033F20696
MSDALLNALAEALAGVVASIDASDEEELDPDIAVRWLEDAGAVLDRLSPAGRTRLARLFRDAAARQPAGPARSALLRVPEGFGLDDDQHERYCDEIEHLVRRLTALARDADPAAPVPTCPGWTVADLVRHHGTTHRWAAHTVRIRAAERVWARDVPLDLPDDPSGLPDWLARAADASLAVLRKADPDTPMWSCGADQRVAHYPRRLLFEAVVHLADAELALGADPVIEPGTAADGIEEFLENLPLLPHLAGPVAELPAGSLLLSARDSGAVWTISFGPDGFAWTPNRPAGPPVSHDHPSAADRPAAEVTADAADLLLLVYGRRAPGDPGITVTGDRPLLAAWRAATAF